MPLSIFLCLETLLDLVLQPGWNKDYDNFEQRQPFRDTLRQLVETGRVVILVPPFWIPIIHLMIQEYLGTEQANAKIQEILAFAEVNFRFDIEQIFERATLISQYPGDIELYDVMMLFCGIRVQADAILVKDVMTFRNLVEHHPHAFSDFAIPIQGTEEFTNFLEAQENLLQDNFVYVYTPEHQIIKLPKGSTPVDFAYYIHTKVGDRCIRALVNNQDAPLSTPLKTKDVVEIIKGSHTNPNPHWLGFVNTRIAKRGIQRAIRRDTIKKGWDQIKALGNMRFYRPRLEHVKRVLNLNSTEDLMFALGSEEITLDLIQDVMQTYDYQVADTRSCNLPGDSGALESTEKVWYVAFCCIPLPGDTIVGILGKNKRRVHCSDCETIQTLASSQIRPLEWNCDRCYLQLQITLNDQADAFRPVLNLLAEQNVMPDLRSVQIFNNTAKATVSVTISSKETLTATLQEIRNLPNVLQVRLKKPIQLINDAIRLTN